MCVATHISLQVSTLTPSLAVYAPHQTGGVPHHSVGNRYHNCAAADLHVELEELPVVYVPNECRVLRATPEHQGLTPHRRACVILYHSPVCAVRSTVRVPQWLELYVTYALTPHAVAGAVDSPVVQPATKPV